MKHTTTVMRDMLFEKRQSRTGSGNYMLLAELLGVDGGDQVVAREVAAVGHVLHAEEEIQWLSSPPLKVR